MKPIMLDGGIPDNGQAASIQAGLGGPVVVMPCAAAASPGGSVMAQSSGSGVLRS
jgi:hypothetical protein